MSWVVSSWGLFGLIFGCLGGRLGSFLVVLGVVLGSWGGLGALLGGLGAVLVVLLRDGTFTCATWVDFWTALGAQEAAKTPPRRYPEASRRPKRAPRQSPRRPKVDDKVDLKNDRVLEDAENCQNCPHFEIPSHGRNQCFNTSVHDEKKKQPPSTLRSKRKRNARDRAKAWLAPNPGWVPDRFLAPNPGWVPDRVTEASQPQRWADPDAAHIALGTRKV